MSYMNLKNISMGLSRLSCSRYSEYDDLVIETASELGLPIIGGTAVELLGSHFNKSGFRKRSDNDLDFISTDASVVRDFSSWLRENVDPDKVKVDTMLIRSHVLKEDYILNLGGTLVMCPEYLVWSKLRRFADRDVVDIKWLLQVCDFDFLEEVLSDLGVTDEEVDKLNGIIDSVRSVLSDSKRDTGCLMVGLIAPYVEDLRKLLDFDDLHNNGIEFEPHVTVLYGLNTEEFPDVLSLGVETPVDDISVLFTGLSFFENDRFDVLKFDIHSDILHSLFEGVTSFTGVKSDYDVYHPHCTVAYLKAGRAEKYKALVNDFMSSHTFPAKVGVTEYIYSKGSEYSRGVVSASY